MVRRKRCPTCGTIKKSGKLSCCARGGAWFKKCGDPGDNFEYTWFEGMEACKGKPISRVEPILTPSAATAPRMNCLQCGTMKPSGKLSCCARGGAWFKKCGDPGNSNVQHTWFEGMQACKGKPAHVRQIKTVARAGHNWPCVYLSKPLFMHCCIWTR